MSGVSSLISSASDTFGKGQTGETLMAQGAKRQEPEHWRRAAVVSDKEGGERNRCSWNIRGTLVEQRTSLSVSGKTHEVPKRLADTDHKNWSVTGRTSAAALRYCRHRQRITFQGGNRNFSKTASEREFQRQMTTNNRTVQDGDE